MDLILLRFGWYLYCVPSPTFKLNNFRYFDLVRVTVVFSAGGVVSSGAGVGSSDGGAVSSAGGVVSSGAGVGSSDGGVGSSAGGVASSSGGVGSSGSGVVSGTGVSLSSCRSSGCG